MRRKILISSSLIYGAFLMLSGCRQEEMEQEPLQEIHKNEVHFHSEDKHVHTYDLNKLAKKEVNRYFLKETTAVFI